MNKLRRNELTQLKYKKRVSLWVSNLTIYLCKDGTEIYNPKTIDVINDNGQLGFKNQSVICSCYGCSGYYKYRREDKKKEDRRLLKDYYDSFN